MKKIVNPGKIEVYPKRAVDMFCKIEYTDGRLSISGVEGPYKNGNCAGSCGQIIMGFKEYDERGYNTLDNIAINEEWSKSQLKKFFDVWDKWHLNDMQQACEHQRKLGWTYENNHGMYVEKPRKIVVIDEYDDGTSNDPIQKWDDYKGHLCPVCGYSIGSAWLTMEVPQDIIDFLFNLPDTKITPAWV